MKSRKTSRYWIAALQMAILAPLCLTQLSRVSVADERDAPPSAPASAAADAGTAGAFEDLHSQWQAAVKELVKIRGDYPLVDDAELPEMKRRWDELLVTARLLMPQLRAEALAVYQADPGANRAAETVLLDIAQDEVRADRYEQAAELTTALQKGGCRNKRLPELVGMVAFATHDFETAGTALRQAEANGVLSAKAREARDAAASYVALWEKEQQLREKESQANDLPRVKLETSKGDIVLELFENEAPQAVANFISLVESGFYNNLSFHRVLPGFMAQGGCPTGDGTGGPGYDIYCECHREGYRPHFRGTLSMAHAGRDTGGSQFFLTFVPTPSLNGRHTAFGRVIDGLDILAEIQRRDPKAPIKPEADRIKSATVLRKRDHAYVPTKVTK